MRHTFSIYRSGWRSTRVCIHAFDDDEAAVRSARAFRFAALLVDLGGHGMRWATDGMDCRPQPTFLRRSHYNGTARKNESEPEGGTNGITRA